MQQPKVDWTCLAFGYSFLSSWHNLSSRWFINLGRAFITWLRTWTVPCVSLHTLSSLQSISSSSVERAESGLGLAPSLVGDAHACLVVSRSASRGPWSKGILHYLLCLLISVLSLHLGFTLPTKILLLYQLKISNFNSFLYLKWFLDHWFRISSSSSDFINILPK